MGKKTFNASVLPKMRAFTARLVGPKDCVLAGLSGGADSVCLLHFLHYLAATQHFALAAVHINHQLRAEAQSDQDFCEQLCKKLDVEFFAEKVNARETAEKYDLSPEHGARKARYEAFKRVAQKWGATKLALGHHLDDQAETFLLNLLRGNKVHALAGIPLRRPLTKDTEIVRPLLCVTRAETEEYLAQNHLSHVTDETNFDDTYRRNWIRHTLLPLLETKQPQIRLHLAQMAQEIGEKFPSK